jgi:hypothetical protein
MFAAAWHVLVQLAPWLLLGTTIAGVLHVMVPKGLIRRQFQGKSGVIQAVVLGVPLPLCSCGVIPAGIGLKRDGASDGASIGFLISTPQTGVDAVLMAGSFLGWPFAFFKVASAAITGMVGGWLADFASAEAQTDTAPADSNGTASGRGWGAAVSHGLEVIRSIWIWLMIGVVVSAAIQVYVPPAMFERLQHWGSFPSALAALAISLPLYVCATASVPIAAALVAGGLPPGAALVFLMAGPATNVATMGAVFHAFGRRVLVVYLSTIILGSLGFAMAFDWLLPGQIEVAEHALHEHGSGWFSHLCAGILLAMFAWFALQDLLGRWRRASAATVSETGGIRVEVQGIYCQNCVDRLESALRAAKGVRSATVQLDEGAAIVHGTIEEPQLRDVIRESGFELIESEALSTAD